MEPQPGLPSIPSGADIARYNAWADRNGQPHYGQAAPVAPAAPPAPKRRGKGRPGLPMPVRPGHGVVPQNEEGGGWRRGTTWDKRAEWGWKTNRAKPVKLRQFNSRTGEDKWFPNGRDYYDHNRQKFIINVPCLGYIPYSKTNEGLKAALIGLLLGGGNQMPPPSDDPDADDTANEPLMRSTFYGRGHSARLFHSPQRHWAITAVQQQSLAYLI